MAKNSYLADANGRKHQPQKSKPSPISQLPLELLINVFQLALQDSLEGERRPLSAHLSKFALTCRHWKTVVDQSPGLWSYIRIHDYFGGQNSRNLSKSLNYPLDVQFVAYLPLLPKGTAVNRMHRTFVEACAHIQRWRYAELDLPKSKHITQYVEHPAPTLKTAILRLSSSERVAYSIDLFKGQADRLEDLSISGFGIPWNSTILSNLRSLSITHSWLMGPSVSQILRILQNCLGLIQFRIGHVSMANDVTPPDPVHLNALEVLETDWLPSEALVQLLTHISAPACKVFRHEHHVGLVDTGPTSRSKIAVDAVTPFFLSTIKPRETPKVKLNLTFGPGSVKCHLTTETGGEFHVRFSSVWMCAMLFRMVRLFEPILPTVSTTIHCDISIGASGSRNLCQIMSQFETVEEIEVVSAFDEQHVILVAELTSRHSEPGWRFPKLHTLRLKWDLESLEAVGAMVEARYGQEDPPRPFKYLTIERPRRPNGVEKEERARIEALVKPQGEVLWPCSASGSDDETDDGS